MILYVRMFVVDLVVKFSLQFLFFSFFLRYFWFLCVRYLTFCVLLLDCFLIFMIINVKFSFSINGKGSFLCGCCVIFFGCVLFFIQCEYWIALNVEVPKNQLHSDYSDNLKKVGNVANSFFVIDLNWFLLLVYILSVMMFHFLQGKIYYFVVFQL